MSDGLALAGHDRYVSRAGRRVLAGYAWLVKVQVKRTRRPALPGLFFVLTVVLLVLKLTGVTGWSWWLVLLPLWCPVVIVLLFVAYFLVSAGTDRLSERMAEWRIRRRHAGDNPELWL